MMNGKRSTTHDQRQAYVNQQWPVVVGRSSISVAIIARDEERHISAALRSAQGLADEIIVLLDARTSDRTAEICREHGARVIIEPWRGFSAQRNRALELCASEWVFFLDADERISDELRDELLDTMTRWRDEAMPAPAPNTVSPSHPVIVSPAGYSVPRHNNFFGHVMRGGGWYPDRQLRLLHRAHAHYDEARQVHEYPELDGAVGQLSGHLLHLNIEHFDELWRKQTHYAIDEAQTLYRNGRRARWRNFIGAPLREFQRRYIALGGWRDGRVGLLLCGALAYFEIVKFAHLKGLERING